MAEALPFLVLAFVGLVMPASLLIYRLRIRKGAFDVSRHAGGVTVFRTELGRFTLERDRLIAEPKRGALREVLLSDVRGLRFSHSAQPAFEEMFFDFDLWDLSTQWRDQIEWYGIAVVTASGDVPLFLAGQLERREPFMQWWIDWTENLLASLHLYDDVETRALSVLNQLRTAFRAAGRVLPLA